MQFCENCGKQLADGEVCTCQASAPTAAPTQAAPAKNDNKKKLPILIGIVAAVVVVIILICVIAGNLGGSYKKPLNDFVKLINKKTTDVTKYQSFVVTNPMDYKLYSETLKILKKTDDYKDDLEDAKDELSDIFEELSDDYGKWSLKLDISSVDEIKKSELNDYEDNWKDAYENYYEDYIEDLEDYDSGDYEDLADDYDISTSDAKKLIKAQIACYKSYKNVDVSEGYTVKFRFYFHDGEEKEDYKTDKYEVTVLKINGSWFIYNPSVLFNALSYGSDDFSIDLNGVR